MSHFYRHKALTLKFKQLTFTDYFKKKTPVEYFRTQLFRNIEKKVAPNHKRVYVNQIKKTKKKQI